MNVHTSSKCITAHIQSASPQLPSMSDGIKYSMTVFASQLSCAKLFLSKEIQACDKRIETYKLQQRPMGRTYTTHAGEYKFVVRAAAENHRDTYNGVLMPNVDQNFRLHARLQECNGDEVLEAQAGAKVQKFTELTLKCFKAVIMPLSLQGRRE
ncbi:hypothetical protein Tco_0356339 [Tanacetum coccineum]